MGNNDVILGEARRELKELTAKYDLLNDLVEEFVKENNDQEARITYLEDSLLVMRDNVRENIHLAIEADEPVSALKNILDLLGRAIEGAQIGTAQTDS